MISVILPSYNRRAFTARAVASVFAQTCPDFEIIVIDDHSRPEEIYQPGPEAAGRVRVIRLEVNGGAATARNTGVRAARGELLAFLDSDDLWLPHRLEDHLALFRRQPDPEKVLVYSPYYTTGDNALWTQTPPFPLRRAERLGDYLVLACGDVNILTWFGTRALFEAFPFDPHLRQSEDWDVLLRMEAAGIRFVPASRPSALRQADLRPDRLTTVLDPEAQTRFLAANRQRLGARAALLLDALLQESQQTPRSPMESLRFKLAFFAASPHLGPGEKIDLVVRYLLGRLRRKIQARLKRGRFNPGAETAPGQVPESGGISDRMK
jgi:glycosyltransferase involved in cell wall biosynthesis